ncbi:hypothetical protein R1flu_007148 [Riccia fluitans]|uniref:Uncharacterized protein n=1 Tax=Riccia fluitans TaxID=41844 RepID=A0ABD1YZ57_9MARC
MEEGPDGATPWDPVPIVPRPGEPYHILASLLFITWFGFGCETPAPGDEPTYGLKGEKFPSVTRGDGVPQQLASAGSYRIIACASLSTYWIFPTSNRCHGVRTVTDRSSFTGIPAANEVDGARSRGVRPPDLVSHFLDGILTHNNIHRRLAQATRGRGREGTLYGVLLPNYQLAVLSPQVRWENFRRGTCLLALDVLPDFTAEACYSGFSRAGSDWDNSLGV